MVECLEEGFGKVRNFDVLIHSAFGEDVFYRNSDITCGAYGNVGLGHKETVCNLVRSLVITTYFFLEISEGKNQGSIFCLISFSFVRLWNHFWCHFNSMQL